MRPAQWRELVEKCYRCGRQWCGPNTLGTPKYGGDDELGPSVQEKRLREEAESFGLWNPETMACTLGFGDEDMLASMVDKDEKDDFLAEFLGNIGESSFEMRAAVGARPAQPLPRHVT
jgi:hypothetical protein